MKQQMISFTEPQSEFLIANAERLGISVSELVRRTVDWYIETYPPTVTIVAKDPSTEDSAK